MCPKTSQDQWPFMRAFQNWFSLDDYNEYHDNNYVYSSLVSTWKSILFFVLFVIFASRLMQKNIKIFWYLFLIIAIPRGKILCSKIFEESVNRKWMFESKETLNRIDFRYPHFFKHFQLKLSTRNCLAGRVNLSTQNCLAKT